MNLLFVHNNFPAQFRHVAAALGADDKFRVIAIGSESARHLPGVRLLRYSAPGADALSHPFARRFDAECRRAEQVLYLAVGLRSEGFLPDVIIVHCGWGESIPLRAVFPAARIIVYCEFYYRGEGLDVGFDHEFPAYGVDGIVGLHARNAATLLALAEADCGVSPTHWQRSTFPALWQTRITVMHDGIDTEAASPNPDASIDLPSGASLKSSDQVVTFVARNLEPMRGFHIFMRALPDVLRRYPRCHVLIVGGHSVSYGPSPANAACWRDVLLNQLHDSIDLARVTFLGAVSYEMYIRILQISTVHVYLTYPFVLSWSMLEAMSSECLVVGSDTPPVREMLNEDIGVLVPFFDVDRLSQAISECIERRTSFRVKRINARKQIVRNMDSKSVTTPNWVSFIKYVAGG